MAREWLHPRLSGNWNSLIRDPKAVTRRGGHTEQARSHTQLGTRDDLARYMASETIPWGKLIREGKITAQ